jgi:hypothetical protein
VRRRNAKAEGRIGLSKIKRTVFLRERTGVPEDDEAFRNLSWLFGDRRYLHDVSVSRVS